MNKLQYIDGKKEKTAKEQKNKQTNKKYAIKKIKKEKRRTNNKRRTSKNIKHLKTAGWQWVRISCQTHFRR